jgi:predicted dehydrogenase
MAVVRFGVISTARIGVEKVIPAIQRAENCEVTAIASRHGDTAEHIAGDLGIPHAFASYDALVESPDIDAVYIPLPNDLHAEWTLRAADAGKHVLCEKPLAMSSAQAQEMVDGCVEAGVKLQEAFMYRHHPTWVEAMRLVESGALGTVQAVQSFFSYYNDDPSNIRNRVENGGGATMDIGCYSINLSRMVFGAEPIDVESTVLRDPVMGIDITTSAAMSFPSGGQASFTCSIRSEEYQRVHIVGTGGRIEIEIPFNIPPDIDTRIFVTAGGDPPVAPATEAVVFPPADQYTIQAEVFASAILDDTPVPVDPSDAVGNMRVIERVLGST